MCLILFVFAFILVYVVGWVLWMAFLHVFLPIFFGMLLLSALYFGTRFALRNKV